MSDSYRDLNAVAEAHAAAGRFDEAEAVRRQMIKQIEPDDRLHLWIEFAELGGILNMLDRSDEGTEMYRRALAEAQELPGSVADTARYMLGNQYLLFGDPRDALEVVEPIPAGVGHVQCLLHAVAAEALWTLERKDEARMHACSAVDASPTDDRRSQLSDQLRYILRVG